MPRDCRAHIRILRSEIYRCFARQKGRGRHGKSQQILQSLVNPPSDNKNELNSGFRLFREGDKVMQIKTITISIGTAIRSPAREFLTETSE